MKVAVVSLRFAPGHIAHLRAYRELFSSLGCEIKLFVDKNYQGFIDDSSDVVFLNTPAEILQWNPDRVFSYNIANDNIGLAKQCKKGKVPFFYVLHEPCDSFKETLSLGKRMPRRLAANAVNYLTAHYAHKVVLASENGKKKYLSYMKGCNKNYAVFPLIFCDDYDAAQTIERKYFSFIGGFTEPRACSAYLDFVKYSIRKQLGYKFCVATRNSIDGYINDPVIKAAIDDGSLVVSAGKPMTSEEINRHYREAICAWNAYKMSTQSGVLPNALMQGTPVLVTDRGDSADIVNDKQEVCFISLPHNNEEIKNSINYIRENLERMSTKARETFLRDYYYGVYLQRAKDVYEIK